MTGRGHWIILEASPRLSRAGRTLSGARPYSTVTLLARFLGWSTSLPR